MDDIFDIISRHPYLIVIIFFVLARLFGAGKKGADESAGAESREQTAQRAKAARAERQQQIEKRLAEQLRALGVNVPDSSQSPAVPVVTRRPAATKSTGQSTLVRSHVPQRAAGMSEFHEAGSLRDTDKDMRERAEAFGFHEAVSAPRQEVFDTSGFSTFHEAHGLDAKATGGLRSGEESYNQIPEIRPEFGALRQGIVMAEILGPPMYLRHIRGRGMRIL